MGDPITISDESGDGLRLTVARTTDKGVETPHVEGRTPWPIGLHFVRRRGRRMRKSGGKKKKNKNNAAYRGSCRIHKRRRSS